MKSKLLVCCALLISAVVVSAIPWSPDAQRQSTSLIKAGKLAEVRAYLDTIDANRLGHAPLFRTYADYVDASIDTSTPAKIYAIAEGYHSEAMPNASPAWLKKASEYAVLWVILHGGDKPEEALAYFNTLENPVGDCVGRAVVALQKLGRNDEALALAVANKQWYNAFRTANSMRDAVKTFEYGQKLLLEREQKANIVNRVLVAINNYNYADTIVTDEVKIKFYKEVDKKYRKFMAIDEATWKPILAQVLYSLKALGVEVVE